MNKNQNRKATFVNTLTAGDVFYFDGYPHTPNVVMHRVSEPGRTTVTYTNAADPGSAFYFTTVGLATVYTDITENN